MNTSYNCRRECCEEQQREREEREEEEAQEEAEEQEQSDDDINNQDNDGNTEDQDVPDGTNLPDECINICDPTGGGLGDVHTETLLIPDPCPGLFDPSDSDDDTATTCPPTPSSEDTIPESDNSEVDPDDNVVIDPDDPVYPYVDPDDLPDTDPFGDKDDFDGDSIPNDIDPDIDGDTIPNEDDPEPWGDPDNWPDIKPPPEYPFVPPADLPDKPPFKPDDDFDGDDIPNKEDSDIDGDDIPNDTDPEPWGDPTLWPDIPGPVPDDKPVGTGEIEERPKPPPYPFVPPGHLPPRKPFSYGGDFDNDGVVNVHDDDIDGDDIPNETDPTPWGDPTKWPDIPGPVPDDKPVEEEERPEIPEEVKPDDKPVEPPTPPDVRIVELVNEFRRNPKEFVNRYEIKCVLDGNDAPEIVVQVPDEGLGDLEMISTLSNAAQFLANYLETKGVLSHQDDTFQNTGNVKPEELDAHRKRAQHFGYMSDWVRENVAEILPTSTDVALDVVSLWVCSKPHQINMLDAEVKHIGIGITDSRAVLNVGKCDALVCSKEGNRVLYDNKQGNTSCQICGDTQADNQFCGQGEERLCSVNDAGTVTCPCTDTDKPVEETKPETETKPEPEFGPGDQWDIVKDGPDLPQSIPDGYEWVQALSDPNIYLLNPKPVEVVQIQLNPTSCVGNPQGANLVTDYDTGNTFCTDMNPCPQHFVPECGITNVLDGGNNVQTQVCGCKIDPENPPPEEPLTPAEKQVLILKAVNDFRSNPATHAIPGRIINNADVAKAASHLASYNNDLQVNGMTDDMFAGPDAHIARVNHFRTEPKKVVNVMQLVADAPDTNDVQGWFDALVEDPEVVDRVIYPKLDDGAVSIVGNKVVILAIENPNPTFIDQANARAQYAQELLEQVGVQKFCETVRCAHVEDETIDIPTAADGYASLSYGCKDPYYSGGVNKRRRIS